MPHMSRERVEHAVSSMSLEELTILRLIGQRYTASEAAEAAGRPYATVRDFVHRAVDRLGVQEEGVSAVVSLRECWPDLEPIIEASMIKALGRPPRQG